MQVTTSNSSGACKHSCMHSLLSTLQRLCSFCSLRHVSNPLVLYACRSLGSSSSYFSPAATGLLGSEGPLSNLPSGLDYGYGFPINDNYLPPLWVNWNTYITAPVGSVLVAAQFQPTTCTWCCYENNGNWGCGNILNIAVQTAVVSTNNSNSAGNGGVVRCGLCVCCLHRSDLLYYIGSPCV